MRSIKSFYFISDRRCKTQMKSTIRFFFRFVVFLMRFCCWDTVFLIIPIRFKLCVCMCKTVKWVMKNGMACYLEYGCLRSFFFFFGLWSLCSVQFMHFMMAVTQCRRRLFDAHPIVIVRFFYPALCVYHLCQTQWFSFRNFFSSLLDTFTYISFSILFFFCFSTITSIRFFHGALNNIMKWNSSRSAYIEYNNDDDDGDKKKVCEYLWCFYWIHCQCLAMFCCCAFLYSSYLALLAFNCGREYYDNVAFFHYQCMWLHPSEYNFSFFRIKSFFFH